MTTTAAKMGVKVDSMDKVLGEIVNRKEHLSCLKNEKFIKEARTTRP